MNERIIKINDADICTESFGERSDEPVILIMGASASMVWWDDEFCIRLANKGRFVIRFDNRDTGKSTCYEPGKPGYDILNMADDVKGVLDSYEISKTNVVGMSLGGMIAQLFALRYPENALTLTMIASSIFGPDNSELPPVDDKILKYHSRASIIDWKNRNEVIKYMVEGWRLLNGSSHPFDEKRAFRLAEEEFSRANNLLSMFNHALLKGGDEYYGRINEIKIPSLIIHGTQDPVLPYVHGIALRNEIPGARLVTLDKCGHEINFFDYEKIIDEIIFHTMPVYKD